jgi:hypothetical protein
VAHSGFRTKSQDRPRPDEWIAFPRRYLSIESMDSLYPDDTTCLHGTTE